MNKSHKKNNFNVLFLYPNTPFLNPPPVSIGIFSALLKQKGIEVKVFDTTFYATEEGTSDKTKEQNLQVRPFSFNKEDLPISYLNPNDDLLSILNDFEPDLIALSVLEGTWDAGKELLDALIDKNFLVLVGGIFATFAPEVVLKHPAVDMICVGEGEDALIELCQRIRDGKDYENIKNIWVRSCEGKIIKNKIRRVVDINKLPTPDYSVFHEGRLLRPMAGRVYRTVPIETNRGCPYACTFCNSPTMSKLYKDCEAGNFFRKKSMDLIQSELRQLIHKWKAEYVYFLSDTFLAMTDEEFDIFIKIYNEFKLPFWIQSRAETITRYKAKKLKDIGCHRISIGLEHGNAEFRKKILKKKFSNDQMIRASKILAEVGIPLSVNNIIGFPDETRELVFDTIELNRKLIFDTSNAYAFAPFHGTPLYDYSLKKGYISAEQTIGCLTIDTPLDMPHFSRDEVAGLRKTFALYAKMDKKYWPEIRIAEKDNKEGKETFRRLSKIFMKKYFSD